MRAIRLPLKVEIELRAVSRRLGLTGMYVRARRRLGLNREYEQAFNAALQERIGPGDVVWDIGANVGVYAAQFSAWVGPEGQVVAFEPVPATFDRLVAATKELANVTLVPAALGPTAGTSRIYVASDAASGTHSLTPREAGREVLEIAVEVGDQVVSQRGVQTPNVLKIDVEGSEFDVLSGLTATLGLASCRTVACEVHFGVLAARGERQRPRDIEELLQRNGFHTRWTDASHLVATR